MQYTLSSIKVIPYSLVWISLFIVPLQAQDLSFGQKISELDARAQILEVRLSESEDQSRRFRVFIAQAQARLKSRRASSNFIESGTTTPPTTPVSPPISTPLDPKDIPPAPKPIILPSKPRESKGYYLQTFGGFMIPDEFRLLLLEPGKPAVPSKEFPQRYRPIKSHNGFSAGVLFGRDFGRFRLETELSGRRSNIDSINLEGYPAPPYPVPSPYPVNQKVLGSQFRESKINGYSASYGGLVNALYDIDLTSKLDLFFGVGAGANRAKIKVETRNYSDTTFAYQIMTGLAWSITERSSLRLLYKYFITSGSKKSHTNASDELIHQQFEQFGSHNLELGVQVDL